MLDFVVLAVILILPAVLLDIPKTIVLLYALLLIPFTLRVFHALRTIVIIDDNHIVGRVATGPFDIHWSEILAAWDEKPWKNRPSCLFFGTPSDTILVPLERLDEEAILSLVYIRLSPEVLSADARQNLPEAQERAFLRSYSPLNLPIHVEYHWLWKVLLVLGSIMFTIMAFLPLSQFNNDSFSTLNSISVFIFFGAFAVLSWYSLFFIFQSVYLDHEGIMSHRLIGRFYIRWDEIQIMTVDGLSTTMLLDGEGKRVVAFGPGGWSGQGCGEARKFLYFQVAMRKIPVRRDPWLAIRPIFSNRSARID